MVVRSKVVGYDAHIHQALLKFCEPQFVAADIGANIGEFTHILSKCCRLVYAFEPDPRNCRILVDRDLPNVVVLNNAVYSSAGEMTLYTDVGNIGASSLSVRAVPAPSKLSFQVNTVTLDDIVETDFDIVKIDVQGAEWEVLKGAKEKLPKVKVLVVEVWDKGLREFGCNSKGLVKLLRQTFDVKVLSRRKSYMDILCVRRK